MTIGKAEPLVEIEQRKAEKAKVAANKTNITIGGQKYVAKQGSNYVPTKEALSEMWKEDQAAIA